MNSQYDDQGFIGQFMIYYEHNFCLNVSNNLVIALEKLYKMAIFGKCPKTIRQEFKNMLK